MTTTTYYNLNIVEGTDVVNPLTVDNPNYEKIDEAMHNNAVAGVTLATEITNATVHAIARENSDCSVIRFIATSEWKAGDTATVDGVPVTALLPSGETLPDGAYVINANVLCILTGTNLTIYAERKKAENANEIAYNNTTVGAELVRLDGENVRLGGEIVRIDSEIGNLSNIIIVNRVDTTPTTINGNAVKSYTVTAPQIDGYKPIMAFNAGNSLGTGNVIAFEGARGFTNSDSVSLSLKNLSSSNINDVYLVAYVLYTKNI